VTIADIYEMVVKAAEFNKAHEITNQPPLCAEIERATSTARPQDSLDGFTNLERVMDASRNTA
jgi:hypothetical protein